MKFMKKIALVVFDIFVELLRLNYVSLMFEISANYTNHTTRNYHDKEFEIESYLTRVTMVTQQSLLKDLVSRQFCERTFAQNGMNHIVIHIGEKKRCCTMRCVKYLHRTTVRENCSWYSARQYME